MSRKANQQVPDHHAVDPEAIEVVKGGKTIWSARVRCPGCSLERILPLTHLRKQAELKRLTGRCKRCALKKIDHGAGRVWGTGKITTSSGYVALTGVAAVQPDDKQLLIDTILTTGQKYVLEQDFVMIKALGRQLYSDERVKHRDGNRMNNNIENLELRSNGEAQTERVADLLAWAQEVTRRYGELEGAAMLGSPTP